MYLFVSYFRLQLQGKNLKNQKEVSLKLMDVNYVHFSVAVPVKSYRPGPFPLDAESIQV